MKSVRLKEIAQELGVSMTLVSRALHGTGRVSPKTRQKVLEASERLGYDCQAQTGEYIAILSPSETDAWNVLCMDILREYGLKGVIMSFRQFSIHDEPHFCAAFYLSGYDRIDQTWYSSFRIPLIVINLYGDPSEKIESVRPDADGEMRSAVEHLASLGHKRIVRLRPVQLDAPKRNLARGEAGFRMAAENAGISAFVRNMNYEPANRIREIIPELLSEGFTAFIVVADPDNKRVLDTFQRCGKRIPEDASLIVYDIEHPNEFGLTAIEINNRRVIETGIRFLLDKLAGKPIPQTTIVSGNFHIRNSTGLVPS